MMAALRTLAPPLGEAIMRRQVERDHFDDGPPVPAGRGNLFEPGPGRGAVSGGWIARERAERAPAPMLLAAAVVGVGAALAARRVLAARA